MKDTQPDIVIIQEAYLHELQYKRMIKLTGLTFLANIWLRRSLFISHRHSFKRFQISSKCSNNDNRIW